MEHVTQDTVRQSHTEKMRERIVGAVEKLFYERGYVHVTIRDIALAAGTSPVNVYRFFASKTQLLETLVQRIIQQVEETCAGFARGEGDASERLSRVILGYQRASTERCYAAPGARDLFLNAILGNRMIAATHTLHMRKLIWELILDGVHNNEFHVTNVDSAARMVCYAITALADPIQVTLKADHDTYLRETEEMCRFIREALESGRL